MTYCYSTGNRVFDWDAPMGRAPQALFVNGRVAARSYVAEHFGQRSGDPWVDHSSLALSVHPLDVKKYRADAHARGLNVGFRDDGMVTFRSRSDQKRYCRAYGFVNFNDV